MCIEIEPISRFLLRYKVKNVLRVDITIHVNPSDIQIVFYLLHSVTLRDPHISPLDGLMFNRHFGKLDH